MSDNAESAGTNFIQVKTTDHQTVWINVATIAGIEPVVGGARTSEHVRVFAGGYKWLVAETHESFMAKVGIPFEKEESSDQ